MTVSGGLPDCGNNPAQSCAGQAFIATIGRDNTNLPRCLTHGSRRRGWVYCLRDDASGAVKIGFSHNPDRRFRQIQTSNPNPLRLIGVMEAVAAFEQFLHWSHSNRRLSGEWFDDADRGVSDLFSAMIEGAA